MRQHRDDMQPRTVETADGHDRVKGDDAISAGHLAGHDFGFLGRQAHGGGMRRAEGEKQGAGGSHATRRALEPVARRATIHSWQ